MYLTLPILEGKHMAERYKREPCHKSSSHLNCAQLNGNWELSKIDKLLLLPVCKEEESKVRLRCREGRLKNLIH